MIVMIAAARMGGMSRRMGVGVIMMLMVGMPAVTTTLVGFQNG